MGRRGRLIAVLAAAALMALPAVAEGARYGGSVTWLTSADVDYLDPGLTYYTFGSAVQYAVNRPLYSFRPDSMEPVPDLASGPPEIAPDMRTITVHLRAGVRYAPPVNREVRAEDVEYAIERTFSRSVASGYSRAYFRELV